MKDGTLLTWKKPDEGDPLINKMSQLTIEKKQSKFIITIEDEIEEIIREYEQNCK